MDALDREILAFLHGDGRATMTEVAQKVGLSLSACHRRFRDLETAGVIRGFRAELDLELLGLPFEALVFVTMRAGDAPVVAEFETAVDRITHVVQAQRLFGEPDYQLYIAARSKQHFQEIYDQQLIQLPGVQRLTSTLIMKTIVTGRTPI